MKRIPISGPSITAKEVAYVKDAVAHAWYGKANVYHQRFEKAFANYLNVRYAIALPSCTSAIHLALSAIGVGKGDEVIVPDITWIASAAPIQYVGATPVFADIDPATWCLSAQAFEQCITKKTKAVIPVDLYGNLPDYGKICKIAKQHRIAIIEDAAEAIGSQYKKQKAGALGDIGVFSFHGSKMVTTGEGGMLVTNQKNIYQRVAILRDHGRLPGDTLFYNSEVAYKYKMSSMQAALGLAQLERIQELIKRKRDIFSWYADLLKDVPGILLNQEMPSTLNTYWMVTVILDPLYKLNKLQLIKKLNDRGIDCRPFFFPLSSLPAYKNHPQAKLARKRNKISYELHKTAVNLPSALNLTFANVKYICGVLKNLLK